MIKSSKSISLKEDEDYKLIKAEKISCIESEENNDNQEIHEVVGTGILIESVN